MSTLTSNPAAATFDDLDRGHLTEDELAREAYENWLETESGVECVDGQIVEKPMAKKSGSVALQIAALLILAGKTRLSAGGSSTVRSAIRCIPISRRSSGSRTSPS